MTDTNFFTCPFFLITRASLAVNQRFKRAFAEAGVSSVRPAFLPVLMILWEEDGLKVVDLGRRINLEPSSMTGLLDRMERHGFLVRSPDPGDRRAHRILLTDLGRSVRAVCETVIEETLNTALAGVEQESLDHMNKALLAVLRNADREVDK